MDRKIERKKEKRRDNKDKEDIRTLAETVDDNRHTMQ